MKKLIIYLNVLVLISSCVTDDENEVPMLSSEKKIESFIIEGIETNISETDKIINLITPASQTEFLFTPQIIVSDKASVSPASETSLYFYYDVDFTVTAEDGTKQIYQSKLTQNSGLQSITLKLESNLEYQTLYYEGVINEVDKKITIDFPKSYIDKYGFETLYLSINLIGENTSSLPESDTEIDIETLNTIQINQPEGNETYSIEFRNTENKIDCFSLPVPKNISCAHYADATYDEYRTGLEDKDLVFFTLEDQDISSLTPDIIHISSGATITPNSQSSQDFTNDIVYEVLSESGDVRSYKVRVIKKKILLPNDWLPDSYSLESSTSVSFYTYYNAISKVTEATLINFENSNEIDCKIHSNNYIDSSTETYIVLEFKTQPTIGEKYYLKVTLEDGSIINTTYKISISD